MLIVWKAINIIIATYSRNLKPIKKKSRENKPELSAKWHKTIWLE